MTLQEIENGGCLWFVPDNLPLVAQSPLLGRFSEWPTAAPAYYLPLDRQEQSNYWQQWQNLFDDFFRLRENLYDGARLKRLAQQMDLADPAAVILQINPRRIDKAYRWGKQLLRNTIKEWQAMMQQAVRLDDRTALSPVAQVWLTRLNRPGEKSLPLVDLPLEVLTELADHAPEFYRRLQIYAVAAGESRNTKT